MNENLIINNSKIFYLYNESPLDAGILDMEELCELDNIEEYSDEKQLKHYLAGPFTFQGSDKLLIIYNINDSLMYEQRMYQLPDSQTQTLVNYGSKNVKLATFLDSETILLQIDYRYFVFDANGEFLDDIDFADVYAEKAKT